MKKVSASLAIASIILLCFQQSTQAQTVVKRGTKYDTVIRKHFDKPAVREEAVIPTPEFINQPYYYDRENNRLIKLENATAQLITKKKTLGLKGAKQSLDIDASSSKIRFTAKRDIVFIMKTSGDAIDITSYIKLYLFVPIEQKREVTISSKEGMLSDKEDAKGKLTSFSVKIISANNYMIQFPDQLDAGEYGFVWLKNMEQKAFPVFAFGVDWKSSN